VNRQQHHEEGTAVGKAYQKADQNEEIETSRPAVPDTASAALAELTGELRQGLQALAVGAGLQVLAALMEADVTAACGPRGKHDPQRSATRHDAGRGWVTWGGRRGRPVRSRGRPVMPVSGQALDDLQASGRAQVLAQTYSHCFFLK
jgi:putative transposase